MKPPEFYDADRLLIRIFWLLRGCFVLFVALLLGLGYAIARVLG
jgi:phage shock protein PspC (stress-responsive transcriptional regulator)